MRLTSNPIYVIWQGAKQRVTNPAHVAYRHYGGRGLVMCKHWLNDFSRFDTDMGPRPRGTSIDRRDNDLGYLCPLCCPPVGNCRWATRWEQANNQRKSSGNAVLIPAMKLLPTGDFVSTDGASTQLIPTHNWRAHWLTAQEFARMMGRRPQTIYTWLRDGTLSEFGIPTFHVRTGGLHSGRAFIRNIF
jgi:hypothetical protein